MRCNHCLQDQPAEGFYKCSPTKCKECIKSAVKKHRAENLAKFCAYDRMRGSMPHRVAARSAYAETQNGKKAHKKANKKYASSDAARASKRSYLQSGHGKAKRAETMLQQALKHPERHLARMKFGNAVRDGRVIPWPVCAIPECDGKPQAHHPDYSRPLDVVWLCSPHHREVHEMEAA